MRFCRVIENPQNDDLNHRTGQHVQSVSTRRYCTANPSGEWLEWRTQMVILRVLDDPTESHALLLESSIIVFKKL